MRLPRWLVVGLVAAAVLPVAPLHAIYMQVFLDTVPVARLIENLSRQLQKAPDNGDAHWALGRAHAMAASNPARSVEVTNDRGTLWFGYTSRFAPFDPVPVKTSTHTGQQIRQHLAEAIAHHQRALALLRGSAPVRLGLAWCFQQAGRRSEAMREYRALIAGSGPKEGTVTTSAPGGHALVAEAAGYLIPLLDPVGDREEIRALQIKVLALERLPVPITPIVVDLGGTGQVSRLIAPDATVHFDLDGRGAPRQWEWITPEAAWLAWDPQHTGRITSGTQLFGSVTFLMFWRTGYDALTVLDDDGDGWLRGNELLGLVLWQDADSDGVSDAGEVTGLETHGIVALATRARSGSGRVVAVAPQGVVYRDGRVAATADLLLHPAALRLTAR